MHFYILLTVYDLTVRLEVFSCKLALKKLNNLVKPGVRFVGNLITDRLICEL